MKQTHTPKTARHSRGSAAQRSSQGQHAVSIAPPAYGLEFVDHGHAALAASAVPVQLQGDVNVDAKDLLQRNFANDNMPIQREANATKAENRTGMPDALKSGLEHLSGLDLSSVRVHYNSPKPAQLNALAYAHGQEVHIGPRQEKHLPHEAWHAVQQMQGRVKPTMQAQGVAINDDPALEHEADQMGTKAATKRSSDRLTVPEGAPFVARPITMDSGSAARATLVQRVGGSHGKKKLLNVQGTYTDGETTGSFNDRNEDISIVKGHGGYQDENALAEAWVKTNYRLSEGAVVTITKFNFFTRK